MIIYTKKFKCELQNIGFIKLSNKDISNFINKVDNSDIYFSDCNSYHWMFDFHIRDIWFSAIEIDNELNNIIFHVYKR